jgi:hypothetical protein
LANELAAVVPTPPNIGLDPITIDGPGSLLPTDILSGGNVRSTKPVIDSLSAQQLDPALLARVLAPFPVNGQATYTDVFPSPQANPLPPGHDGIDIQAAVGTPVIASDAGTVHVVADPTIGNAVVLKAADGTEYHYLHIDLSTSKLAEGQHVLEADRLGTVGPNTGLESGGGAHLHYEIHPRAGAAINPVPYLDRWVAQALQMAKTVVAKAQVAAPRTTATTRRSAAAGVTIRPAAAQRSLLPILDVLLTMVAAVGALWFFRRRSRRTPPGNETVA